MSSPTSSVDPARVEKLAALLRKAIVADPSGFRLSAFIGSYEIPREELELARVKVYRQIRDKAWEAGEPDERTLGILVQIVRGLEFTPDRIRELEAGPEAAPAVEPAPPAIPWRLVDHGLILAVGIVASLVVLGPRGTVIALVAIGGAIWALRGEPAPSRGDGEGEEKPSKWDAWRSLAREKLRKVPKPVQGVLMALMIVGGCWLRPLTIDGSTVEAYRASLRDVASTLPPGRRELFGEALLKLSRSPALEGKTRLDSAHEGARAAPEEIRRELHGRSASGVLALYRQRHASELEDARTALTKEVDQMVSWKEKDRGISQLEVLEPELYFEIIGDRPLPRVRFTLRNKSSIPIASVKYHIVVRPAGKSGSSVDQKGAQDIRGGVEPGRAANVTLRSLKAADFRDLPAREPEFLQRLSAENMVARSTAVLELTMIFAEGPAGSLGKYDETALRRKQDHLDALKELLD